VSSPEQISTYPLPTDTAHVKIESRQYRLFTLDLGEGVDREKLVVGGLIVGAWLALMVMLGVPFMGKGSMFYLFPPSIVCYRALMADSGGRPRYALWWDRVRYLIRRHEAMVPGAHGAPVTPPFLARAEFVVLDAAAITPARSRPIRKASPDEAAV
jgi:hypothetical protein